MKKWIITATVLMAQNMAYAKESAVVEVRRNIPLSDNEPIYRDFYITNPEATLLQKNMVVKLVRKHSVREVGGNTSLGDIFMPVALVKILEVFDKLAIAREYQVLDRNEYALTDTPGVMLGDLVDPRESFIDVPKKVKPKPAVSAAAEEESFEETDTRSLSAEVNTEIKTEFVETQQILEKRADLGDNSVNE